MHFADQDDHGYSPHDMCQCGQDTAPHRIGMRDGRTVCTYLCDSCGTRWSADYAIDDDPTTKETA